MKKLILCLPIFFLSCSAFQGATQKHTDRIKMRGEIPSCVPMDHRPYIKLVFTNQGDKKWYVNPAAIGFEVRLSSGQSAQVHQISHSTTKADSSYYMLNPHDSIRFRVQVEAFDDYALAAGGSYYCLVTYLAPVGKKWIGDFRRIEFDLSSRIEFSVCKPVQ